MIRSQLIFTRRLYPEKGEQDAISNIEHFVFQHTDIQQLIAIEVVEQPVKELRRIKGSLDMDRNIDADIDATMENYQVAVCRKLEDSLLGNSRVSCATWYTSTLFTHKVLLCTSCSQSRPHTYDRGSYETGLRPYVHDSSYPGNDPICPEHFWRDAALGSDMAQELMESFYCHTLFSLTVSWYYPSSRDGPGLPYLLKNNQFGRGLQPQPLNSNLAHGIHLLVDEGSPMTCQILGMKLILQPLAELFLLK